MGEVSLMLVRRESMAASSGVYCCLTVLLLICDGCWNDVVDVEEW